ncbi:aminotransferase class I/II-fold pyridoxal phosphate-dependent enzyme [Methanosarcina sp. KYL-1]|uniref:aminotransferase class I/II-fold pyridoxal phosphate-dependent enzyme n=1 Tax=Methanosarcina sp. KYL-1 TaxID=2602068 RepID=UPI002100EFB7|nr:aminotransferase class I/II-fold pyridoxal phosphate-dependent enzyme [Methanosarcina sp. KYL-1]MCQ1536997.1 aminotransferase class I/II-fold pyridoxal phosphate-dependent enzyme [Methanosarcina sp. KYL-1]
MRIKDFKLERFFAKYEFSAPYLLSSSDCESFTVAELLALEENAEEQFKNLRLGYTEAQGNPELRDEISKLYDNVKPEEVLVFSGAEEGIFIFMNVLLEPGDHIIVQCPAYQSLYAVAEAIGCRVTTWEMKPENWWRPDLGLLKKSICENKNTKAIILNSPHNPTGFQFSGEEFDAIVEIAKANGLYVFSDEVYRFLEYDPRDRLPAAADLYEKGLSLGVMSKTFGLPGLRIGWIAAKDRKLLRRLAAFKDFTTICNSAPSEFLAALALRHREILIERNLEIVRKNLELLDAFFEKHTGLFEWIRPGAGPIAFPELRPDIDVEEFCVDLAEKNGVLLLPGTMYDIGGRQFRIGFGRKNMPEALKEFEKYIEKNL